MTRPGDRLRAWAARWCSADTMARVIDPLLADLQAEHHEALASGRLWRSWWIRIAGVLAFLRVMTICATTSAVHELTTWPAEDRRALRRTLGVFAIAMTALVALLVAGPAYRYYQKVPTDWTGLYLVPMAFPIAVALGFPFGAFLGLGVLSSFRTRVSVMGLAIICSVVCYVTVSWIAPNTNQSFREAAYARVTTSAGNTRQADLPKGLAELSRDELKARIGAASRDAAGVPWRMRELTMLTLRYHRDSALAFASLAVGALAIVAIPRRRARTWLLAAGAFSVSVGYFSLIVAGQAWGLSGAIPILLAAWLPNLVCCAIAGVLMVRSALVARRRATIG